MFEIECPICGGEVTQHYSDGGDPPQSPPYYYNRCLYCGYRDEESIEYEEDGDY